MDNVDKDHPVTTQPSIEKVAQIKSMLHKWESEIKEGENPHKEGQHKSKVVSASKEIKRAAYGGATEEEINESDEDWAEQRQQWVCFRMVHAMNIEQAT